MLVGRVLRLDTGMKISAHVTCGGVGGSGGEGASPGKTKRVKELLHEQQVRRLLKTSTHVSKAGEFLFRKVPLVYYMHVTSH